MKLHEALSTGLEFKLPAHTDWWTSDAVAAATNMFIWSTAEVTSSYWQVRLPDGRVFDLYTETMKVLARLEKKDGVYTQESIDRLYTLPGAEASNIPDIQKDLERAGFLKSSCECGSEAIGGGAHSTWCSKVGL